MLSLIAIAFLLKRCGTHAVPLPVPATISSPFDTPIFARDNPSDGCHSRTVLDILWSCLATTFACTWVSVHPNVPWRNEGKWTLLGRRIYLMFFSILAPEFMIVWAFKQWRGAVMIREDINEARPESNWTTTHGHYLQMGGFSCGGDVMKFNTFKRYLQNGEIRFPDITEDEINDRSKGDALSKGIALLQLTWFIAQIITRHAQGLAITELELTTAALAGLNSVMYIFWWSKPRDVRFPVVIRTKAVETLLAERTEDTTWNFKFSDPEEFDFRKYLLTSMTTPIKDVLGALRNFLASCPKAIKNMLSDLARAISVLPGHIHSFLSRSYRHFLRAIADLKGVKSVEPKRDIRYFPAAADPEPDSEKKNNSRMEASNRLIFTGVGYSRLMHFKMQIYGALISGAKAVAYCFAFLLSVLSYVIDFGLMEPIAQIMKSDGHEGTLPMVFHAAKQVRVLSMMFYSEDAEPKSLFSTSSIAGALFGAVHCLAWHFSFPSHAEQIMWRTASLGIVGACALSIVGTYTFVYVFDALELLAKLLLVLTAAIYPVFRLMLLVLAVTSLRSLPSSAFDTVQWIEFVPHI